jgi:hypothetical protein
MYAGVCVCEVAIMQGYKMRNSLIHKVFAFSNYRRKNDYACHLLSLHFISCDFGFDGIASVHSSWITCIQIFKFLALIKAKIHEGGILWASIVLNFKFIYEIPI